MACSAIMGFKDIKIASEIGLKEYITKPVSLDQLKILVLSYLVWNYSHILLMLKFYLGEKKNSDINIE